MLKFIALVVMLIDHIGAKLLPQFFFLRIIGRLSFPIFAYMVATGAKRTRDLDIYISRMLIFAFVSQIPFVYSSPSVSMADMSLLELSFKSFLPGVTFFASPAIIGHPGLNIGFTFCFALMAIKFINQAKEYKNDRKNVALSYLGVVAMILVAFFLRTDYMMYGVAMVLVFYNFSIEEKSIYPKLIYILPLLINVSTMIVQSASLLTVPIIKRFKDVAPSMLPRWVYYGFYPAHLFILGIIMRQF